MCKYFCQIFFSFFFIFNICNAQGDLPPKATKDYQNISLSDTIQAVAYKDTCLIHYKKREFDTAALYANKAIEIYLKNKIKTTTLALLYDHLGDANTKLGFFSEAIAAYQSSIEVYYFLGEEQSEIYAFALNKKATALRENGELDKSIEISKKALDIYNSIDNPQLNWHIATYHNLSISSRLKGDFDVSIQYSKKGLDLVLNKSTDSNIEAVKFYNSIGNVYLNTGKYEECLNYFKKGLNYLYKLQGPSSKSAFIFKQNIGIAYFQIRNFNKALYYFKDALNDCDTQFGKSNLRSILIYSSIGNLYRTINEFDKALFYHDEQQKLAKDLYKPDHPNFADFTMQYGLTYESMGNFEKSQDFFLKSIEEYLKIYDENNIKVATVYGNFSGLLLKMKKADEALTYAFKAEKIFKKFLGENNFRTSYAYNHIGKAYHLKKDYANALQYYKKSLASRIKSSLKNNSDIIAIHSQIGQLYEDQGLFKEAIRSFESAIEITENIKLSNLGIARDYFQSFTNPVYEQIIKSTLKLDTIATQIIENKIFTYAEKSKASTLLRTIVNTRAKHFSNIPDSLIKRESKLKIEINALEKLKRDKSLSGASDNESEVLELDNNIYKSKNELNNLLKSFEENHPSYYNLKYNHNSITLDSIQSSLSIEQSLIEYLVGDSTIFIMVVNNDNFYLHKIPNDFGIDSLTSNLRESLTKYHISKPMPASSQSILARQYVEIASKLYAKLIQPIEKQLKENVVIIPDGITGYIPFELLLSKSPEKLSSYHAYPYFFKDYNISYCYSATLLNEMTLRDNREKAKKTALAIAPFFDKNSGELVSQLDTLEFIQLRSDTLKSLNYSGLEVTSIANLTFGDKWVGLEANIEKFKKVASEYKILHLSTHGVANDKLGDYAYLTFGNKESSNKYNQLFIRDVYDLELNADMVVLSACNTAYGKLQKGEGIISLARAFAYAGAKSIVTTHWSVNDKSTSILMKEFYRLLVKEKLPKDQALRQAKLNYINNNRGLKAHPYYWAAFIGIGDMAPIQNYN